MEIRDKFPSVERNEISFLSPQDLNKINSNFVGRNDKN